MTATTTAPTLVRPDPRGPVSSRNSVQELPFAVGLLTEFAHRDRGIDPEPTSAIASHLRRSAASKRAPRLTLKRRVLSARGALSTMVDDPGTYIAIAFVAGCVAAGTLLRAWALLAAVVVCFVGFVASGAEALSWLWLFIGLPVMGGAVLLGWALRLVPRRRMWLLPASVAAPALLVSAALAAHRTTLDTVPANVAAQLPHDTGALGVLCIDELPANERRAARRQLKALTRELPRRSDQLVTVGYTLAESPGADERERTLRELAKELLSDNTCSSPEADVLRQALSDAG